MSRRPPAVARVLERVTATAREHEMFSPGDKVLVAVSGGPDSTCLLHSLYMLRRLFKIEPEVFHFDHKLRPDSAKDAQYVKRMAAKLELPFHLRIVESQPEKGESVEAWARGARYSAALEVLAETGGASVATGHTLDDQVETVLIGLIRGGGLERLAGIAQSSLIAKPMLGVRRSEVAAFCRALRLRPRLDSTNLDTRYLRNAVRLKVIPAIEEATGRDIGGPIARSARLLQQDLAELRPRRQYELGRPADDGFDVSVRGLTRLPQNVASRVVEGILVRLQGSAPTEKHIEAVLDLIAGRPGRRRDLPGGLIAVREKEYVHLSRTSPGSRRQTRWQGGSLSGKPSRNRGPGVAR